MVGVHRGIYILCWTENSKYPILSEKSMWSLLFYIKSSCEKENLTLICVSKFLSLKIKQLESPSLPSTHFSNIPNLYMDAHLVLATVDRDSAPLPNDYIVMLVFSQLILEARSQSNLLKNNSKLDEFTFVLKLLPRPPTSESYSNTCPDLGCPPWAASALHLTYHSSYLGHLLCPYLKLNLPCYLPTAALAVLSAWNILSPSL